jgi:hypothetical protein
MDRTISPTALAVCPCQILRGMSLRTRFASRWTGKSTFKSRPLRFSELWRRPEQRPAEKHRNAEVVARGGEGSWRQLPARDESVGCDIDSTDLRPVAADPSGIPSAIFTRIPTAVHIAISACHRCIASALGAAREPLQACTT